MTYHLCHVMDPIYPQKGATCPCDTFLCTYVLRQGKARHGWQGMAGMAWHGMVWEGMLVTYHLCHMMDPIYPHPIYPQKGATCPCDTVLCTNMLVMA